MMMNRFVQQRHKPASRPLAERQLIVALPPLRSHVNLARIVRTAGCCGVRQVIACGSVRIDAKIARDSLEWVHIRRHRSLLPVLRSLKSDEYQLVGLEQTTQSQSLHRFPFSAKTVLVIGHERTGIDEDVLAILDAVVEIPVYGRPLSYNVATAAAMALYEYCRQYP